jgi:hypothetical protein
MNSLIEALRSGSDDFTRHLGTVKELRSALIEVGLPDDEQTIISKGNHKYPQHYSLIPTAKIIWNETVMHDAIVTLHKPNAQFLTLCRELALLAMQKYIHPPWDDKILLTFFEMATRVARAFSRIGERGQARLYMSRATDIKEEMENKLLMGPTIKIQFDEALSLYYAERIRQVCVQPIEILIFLKELFHGELEELLFQHLDDSLAAIDDAQLPMVSIPSTTFTKAF